MALRRLIKTERGPVSSISFPQRSCRVSGFAFLEGHSDEVQYFVCTQDGVCCSGTMGTSDCWNML